MKMNHRLGVCAIIVLGMTAAACSDDEESTTSDAGPAGCKIDSDCNDPALRCGYDGSCYAPWACLGANDWPTKVAPFHVKTRVEDIVSPSSRVSDLDAIACVTADPYCQNNPAANGQAVDADGVLDIPFDSAFTGLVRITAAGDYVPTFLHALTASPWTSDFVTARPTYLVPGYTLDALPASAGIVRTPTSTLMTLELHDCGGRPASGVTVTMPNSPDAKFIPLNADNVPVVAQRATNASGMALVVNAPADSLLGITLVDGATSLTLDDSLVVRPRGDGFNSVVYYPSYAAVQAWMAEYARQQEP